MMIYLSRLTNLSETTSPNKSSLNFWSIKWIQLTESTPSSSLLLERLTPFHLKSKSLRPNHSTSPHPLLPISLTRDLNLETSHHLLPLLITWNKDLHLRTNLKFLPTWWSLRKDHLLRSSSEDQEDTDLKDQKEILRRNATKERKEKARKKKE